MGSRNGRLHWYTAARKVPNRGWIVAISCCY